MPQITHAALAAIHAHAMAASPEECCGVLLGRVEGGQTRITEAIPAQNLATSNRMTRYFLDPRAIVRAEQHARLARLEVLGFYHSHPDHAAIPSATDNQLAWDEYLYLILPLKASEPGTARVWRFTDHVPQEMPLDVLPANT